jgi:hypothetical protein
MNDSGTNGSNCAETVPKSAIAAIRAGILVKRRQFGADSPAGHRCSNIDEILQNREKATGDQLIRLDANLAAQVAELADLSNAPGRNIYKLDLARLREVLDYDPETGALTWRIRTGPMCKLGELAGQIGSNGYRKIRIDDTYHTASHLAWFHFYGVPPTDLLDHKNRDKADDRIENLRPASHADNSHNMGRNRANTTGFKGVAVFNQPGKPTRYRALIRAGGKRHFLGIFDTPEEASEAYRRGAAEHHGDFADASPSPKGDR